MENRSADQSLLHPERRPGSHHEHPGSVHLAATQALTNGKAGQRVDAQETKTKDTLQSVPESQR